LSGKRSPRNSTPKHHNIVRSKDVLCPDCFAILIYAIADPFSWTYQRSQPFQLAKSQLETDNFNEPIGLGIKTFSGAALFATSAGRRWLDGSELGTSELHFTHGNVALRTNCDLNVAARTLALLYESLQGSVIPLTGDCPIIVYNFTASTDSVDPQSFLKVASLWNGKVSPNFCGKAGYTRPAFSCVTRLVIGESNTTSPI
jgi:hypothetical protein